jgi:hypothetical protein
MNLTLPSAEAPKPVSEATEALCEAEASLAAARTKRQEAEGGLREAQALDRQALADRLRTDPDARPSREHRSRAEAELAEAEEVEAAAKQNVETATERASSMALEHLPAWREGVEKAREKADATFSKAVARLKEAEAARSELRGLDAWLGQLATSGRTWLLGGAHGQVKAARPPMAIPGRLSAKDPRSADAMLPVAFALDLLAEYSQASSVEGERAAAEERAERERQAEQRRQELRQARAGLSGAMTPGGS